MSPSCRPNGAANTFLSWGKPLQVLSGKPKSIPSVPPREDTTTCIPIVPYKYPDTRSYPTEYLDQNISIASYWYRQYRYFDQSYSTCIYGPPYRPPFHPVPSVWRVLQVFRSYPTSIHRPPYKRVSSRIPTQGYQPISSFLAIE